MWLSLAACWATSFSTPRHATPTHALEYTHLTRTPHTLATLKARIDHTCPTLLVFLTVYLALGAFEHIVPRERVMLGGDNLTA